MEDDSFLTTEEVLSYLHLNLRTVYRLIRTGRLPAFRVGRQWRFRKEDIDAWLAARRARGIRYPSHSVPRVLVVDDERPVREMLAKTLSRGKYAVEMAESGTEALEHIREGEIDLVITDLRMPGMDGLALMRAARRYDPNLPVIVVTGYSSEASAIEAINIGVSGYLTKPFRVDRILRSVARALGQPTRASQPRAAAQPVPQPQTR
jgi:excisionase family DNA binding protein